MLEVSTIRLPPCTPMDVLHDGIDWLEPRSQTERAPQRRRSKPPKRQQRKNGREKRPNPKHHTPAIKA